MQILSTPFAFAHDALTPPAAMPDAGLRVGFAYGDENRSEGTVPVFIVAAFKAERTQHTI